MFVKDIMTRQVAAIDPDMPIADVHALMEQRNIRHFPIIESDRLVGIVSDRDIKLVGSEHPEALKDIRLQDAVRKIMVFPVLSAHPLDAVEEAAKVLRENKIGAMPVMQGEELVGIVTGIDFLDALVKLSGVYDSTSRLDVELSNRPGSLASLLAEIAKRNINVSSVTTRPSDAGCLCFGLRVGTINVQGLATDLRKAGYSVLWPIRKP